MRFLRLVLSRIHTVAVALVVATVATISLVTPVSAAPHGGDLIYFKNCANINPDEGFYDYLSGYITDFSCEKVDHFAGGGVVSNDFPCTCQCKDYPNAVLDMTMVNKCVFDGDLAACSQICQKNYCPEPTMKYYFKGTGYCCLFWDYENGGCIEDYQRLRTFAANVLRIDASNGVYTYMGVVFSCPTDTTQYDPAVGCACNNGGTFDYSTGECSGSASVTCSAGTYLPANSSTCTTCPAGSYCGGGTYTPSSSDQGATACHEAFTDYGTDTQNVTGGSCSRSMSRTCYHNSGPAGATSASQCNSGSVDCGSWGSYGGWSCSCNAGYEANNAGGACKPCSDYDDVQYDTDTQNVTGGTCTRSKYRRVYYSSSAGGSCAVSSYDNWSYGGWSCSCNAGYEANNSSGSCTACSTYNHYSDWESFSENIDYGWRSGLRRHMIYYSSSAGGTCGVSSYGDWEYSDLSVACSAGYAPNNTNGTCVQESCASGYYARIVNNSNPNPNLSSIIGNTAGGNYTYDNSSKTFSVTYNNSKGTVSGRAQCSTQSSTTNTATATLPDSSGNYCYCKLDSYTPSGGSTVPAQTPWIFMRDNGSCASYCTGWCAVVFNNTYQAELRFRSAAFSAVGATQQCFINCSAGQYLAAGSESCASCPAGSYCASSGSYNYSTTTNQGITGSCAAETYSTGGATTSSCTACTNKPANSSYTSATGNTTSNCPWICNAGYEANSSSTCTACSTYNHYSDWETYTENITGGTRSIQRRYMIYYSSSAGGTCGVSSYGDWEYHTSGWLYACDAGRFYDGACSPCPSGAYCPGDNYYYSCTNAPSNASYTGSGGSTNTCPWACDAGLYWNGSSCADPGAGYYSPAADNNRYECSNKPSGSSYTTSSSSNSCGWACDANLYWDGSNCVDPGVGYYSPAYDNSRYECTNKYAYNSSYTSSSSSNSCSWVCNAGYTYNSSTGACDACSGNNTWQYSSDTENVGCGSRTRSKWRMMYYTSSAGGSCYVYDYGSWNYGDWSYDCTSGSCYFDGGTCSACPTGYYCPSGTNSASSCTNAPSNTHYVGSGGSTNSCAWDCNAGYYGSSAAGSSSCEACGSGNYCTGGTSRAACSGVVNNAGTSPDSVEVFTLSSGSWSDYTHAASINDCYCNFWYHDTSTSAYFYQTTCAGGPAGSPYRHYNWCNTGYYATDPLGWNEWYVSCTACTNKPANSTYTSYSTPSQMYAVEDNCPWQCNAGYQNESGTCVACSTYDHWEDGTDSKSVTGGVCTRAHRRWISYSSSAGGSCTSSAGAWEYSPNSSWSCACEAGYEADNANIRCKPCSDYNHTVSDTETQDVTGGSRSRTRYRTALYTSSAGNACYHYGYSDYWSWDSWNYSCGGEYYYASSDDTACSWVGNGYYSPAGDNSRYGCSNKPANSTYTGSAASNSCPWGCDAGLYWDSSSCTDPGVGYYSPGPDDRRYECTNKPSGSSYTGSASSNNCPWACDANLYWNGSSCTDPGFGYYSPAGDNSRYECSNKYAYNSSYTSSSSSNSCSWVCNAGYAWNGSVCYACSDHNGWENGTAYTTVTGSPENGCSRPQRRWVYYSSSAGGSCGVSSYGDWEYTPGYDWSCSCVAGYESAGSSCTNCDTYEGWEYSSDTEDISGGSRTRSKWHWKYYDSSAGGSCGFTEYGGWNYGSWTPTCSPGWYVDGEVCTLCSEGSYCPGDGNRYSCPDAATYARTTFPANYYSPTIDSTGGGYSYAGSSSISNCYVLTWMTGTRGGLYEYASFNTSTNKYDLTSSYGFASARPGYYLTNKNGCGYYAYYADAYVCPAGSYCPGKDAVVCDGSNASTVWTETFGLNTCSAGTYSGDGATSCSTCAAGTYSGAGAGSCTAVAGGYWNNGCGTDAYGSVCNGNYSGGSVAAGYFSNGGGTSSTGTCISGYSCGQCTGNSWSYAGASSCSACPEVTGELASRTIGYGGWWNSDYINNTPEGCYALITDNDSTATFYQACYYRVADNGYGGPNSYCDIFTSYIQECIAEYYLTFPGSAAGYGYGFINGQVCSPVGTGYYSPDGDLSRYECSNKPANSSYTGSASSNACPWQCNAGYQNESGTCVACSTYDHWEDGTDSKSVTGGVCTRAHRRWISYSSSAGGSCTSSAGAWEYSPNSSWSCACEAGYEADNANIRCKPCSDYNHTVSDTETQDVTGGSRSRTRYRTALYTSSAGNACYHYDYSDYWSWDSWNYSCGGEYYYASSGDTACSWVGNGYYSPAGDNSRYECTNRVANSTYTGSAASNSCSWACDAGLYWNGSSCADPGAGYYSPAADNNRYECSNKPSGSSYTTSSSSNSCGWACDANLYWDGSNCVDPGVGYYSPAYDNSRYECSNKYAYNSSYTSSSSSNSCSWVCNAGYAWNGSVCYACSDHNGWENGTAYTTVTGSPENGCSRPQRRWVYHSSSAGGSCGVSSYGDWEYTPGYDWSCSCVAGYETTGPGCKACSDYDYWTNWETVSEEVHGGTRSRQRRRIVYHDSSAGSSCDVSSYSDWSYTDWTYSCYAEYYYAGGESCTWVGTGYYSPNGDNNRYECTNKPANSAYTWSSAADSCPWACSAGYYGSSAAGSSSCTYCPAGSYCPGDGSRQDCPNWETNVRTTFPDNYYSPVIYTVGVWLTGATEISGCMATNHMETTRGYAFEDVFYNPSTGKYDRSANGIYWWSPKPGYYMTNKKSCGTYAYYNEVEVCPAGSYCPGHDPVTCDSPEYTTNFGIASCPTGYTSTTGRSAESECYITVDGGHYIGTAGQNSTNWGTCDAGYYAPQHTVYYGSTSGCNACTGATYSDTAGASSCTTCPSSIYYANILAGYDYWTADGIHNTLYGCRADFYEQDSTGDYYLGCAYVNGDYGIGGGDSTQCMATVISCAAERYAPSTSIWRPSVTAMYGEICPPVGTGYYSPNNDTNRYECSNKPANSTYTGSAASNACPWGCDAGLYWNGSSCADPGAGYYSPAADNNRYECSNKPSGSSYTTSSSSNSCGWACDANLYWDGSSCVDPGVGYYSPAADNSRYECSNKYAYNSSYTGSSSANNCSWVCNGGYEYNSSTGACDACSGHDHTVSDTETVDITGGTHSRTRYRTALYTSSAGNACYHYDYSDYWAWDTWVPSCSAGYEANGENCKACSDYDHTVSDTETQDVTGGSRSRTRYRTALYTSNAGNACYHYDYSDYWSWDSWNYSCGGEYYYASSDDTACSWVGNGYYSPAGDNSRYECSNKPSGSSYTTSSSSNSCGWACDAQLYWDGSSCVDPGVGYYSPAADNSRYECTNRVANSTYTGSASSNACPWGCDAGLYWNGSSCTDPGVGYYSPGPDDRRYECTNKPANSTYTGSASSNACPWICDAGYQNESGTCVACSTYNTTENSSDTENITGGSRTRSKSRPVYYNSNAGETCGISGYGDWTYGSWVPSCSAGYYADSEVCTICPAAKYCPGDGVAYNCPSATEHLRSSFPADYYSPNVYATAISSGTGLSSISYCQVLTDLISTRGILYEYASYNTSTDEYDITYNHGWHAVEPGYYLTDKNGIGSFLYWATVLECPAGSYCPGQASIWWTGSEIDQWTDSIGIYTCSGGSYSDAGATSCSTCAAGTYSGAGASGCSAVAGGYWNDGCGTDAYGSVCNGNYSGGTVTAGYFSNGGGTSSTGTCISGYSCGNCASSGGPNNRPQYSDAGASSCTECPAYSGPLENRILAYSYYPDNLHASIYNCILTLQDDDPDGDYQINAWYRNGAYGGEYIQTFSPYSCAAGKYSTITSTPQWRGDGGYNSALCFDGNVDCMKGTVCTACPSGTYSPNGDLTCSGCPNGYPNSDAGSYAITQCYSNTKSRAWSGTQTECVNPAPNNCSGFTCGTCSNPACDYVAYSNASGDGDGIIKTGCLSNSDACQQPLSGVTANTNNYVDGLTCATCTSFNAEYPYSDGGNISNAYCYKNVLLTGNQIDNTTVPENCASITSLGVCKPQDCTYRDYYSATDEPVCTPQNCVKPITGVTANANYYVSGNTCVACQSNSTSPAGNTLSACLCDGGYYMNDDICTNVGAGYWSPNANNDRNQCPVGLTTAGYGAAADEAYDCGRMLHLGNDVLYLRSNRKTEHTFNVEVGNDLYYGNMTTAEVPMNANTERKLRINFDNTTYSVYDDTVSLP